MANQDTIDFVNFVQICLELAKDIHTHCHLVEIFEDKLSRLQREPGGYSKNTEIIKVTFILRSLNNNHDKTKKEDLAKIVGTTQQAVSQVEKQALRRLRTIAKNRSIGLPELNPTNETAAGKIWLR